MCCAVASVALADQQVIAPGTGRQSTVVVNTGPNGICETAAASGDVQGTPVGSAAANRSEVRCGTNLVANTVAAGDDVQLVAVGAACTSATKIIIDAGPDGIPDSVPTGDDTYNTGVVFGVPPANGLCVSAGGDGRGQTVFIAGDDDLVLNYGTATPNTSVVLCGPNGIVDTAANNTGNGDDVQLIPVGGACTATQAVVDSGADGISNTRAQGPDLFIKPVKPVSVTIGSGAASGSKVIKVVVSNAENTPSAPASRTYKLQATTGSCPTGTVTVLDADAFTAGVQATATIPRAGRLTAAVTVNLKVDGVINVNRSAPDRCTFDLSAVALDTAPSVDDAENPANNTVRIDLEASDRNDQ